jgi:hypothetical protein
MYDSVIATQSQSGMLHDVWHILNILWINVRSWQVTWCDACQRQRWCHITQWSCHWFHNTSCWTQKYVMPSSSVRCALVTTMMPHDTYRRPFALNDFIVRPYFLSTKCLKRKYQYTPIFFPKTKPRIGFINFMSQALIPGTRTLFCSYNDKTTFLFEV